MISDIRDRLEALPTDAIDTVSLALTLASAMDKAPKRDLECFVIPISEAPTGNARTTGLARQEVAVTVGVMFAVRALNDTRRDRTVDRLEPARTVVREALLGWQPETASVPLLIGRSDLVRIVPGAIYWLDRYTSKTQRQAVAP